jgi:D-arabinose 5-phosphate isomerase GutQ
MIIVVTVNFLFTRRSKIVIMTKNTSKLKKLARLVLRITHPTNNKPMKAGNIRLRLFLSTKVNDNQKDASKAVAAPKITVSNSGVIN